MLNDKLTLPVTSVGSIITYTWLIKINWIQHFDDLINTFDNKNCIGSLSVAVYCFLHALSILSPFSEKNKCTMEQYYFRLKMVLTLELSY